MRFPVGKYVHLTVISPDQISQWINTIEKFPSKIQNLTANLSESDLKATYRPDGWSIRQLVTHCADSHMNSFIRFKLALTEDKPTIRPYYEDRWATGPDYLKSDFNLSLQLLSALHSRWIILLKSLTEKECSREFIHPDGPETITIAQNIGIYAWHCDHHEAHIKIALSNIS